jgi:integrase/recombinase XerD
MTTPTTPLREKMLIDMALADYKQSTKKLYVSAAKGMADYYNRSPEFLTEDEVKHYLLYLKDERKLAKSTLRQKYAGIRFLFRNTLRKPLGVFDFLKAGKERRLPDVLSRDEVSRSIALVKKPMYAMVLKATYSGGLRISETLNMCSYDIDRERMFMKVRLGKNSKDRYVPLSPTLLAELERYWRYDRPKVAGTLFFPGRNLVDRSVSPETVRKAYRSALEVAGITKKIALHSLRHSLATHLLEAGVSLKSVQYILGHKHLTTTLIYAHMTDAGLENLRIEMDKMASDL